MYVRKREQALVIYDELKALMPNPGLSASRKFPPVKTMVHVSPARPRSNDKV